MEHLKYHEVIVISGLATVWHIAATQLSVVGNKASQDGSRGSNLFNQTAEKQHIMKKKTPPIHCLHQASLFLGTQGV